MGLETHAIDTVALEAAAMPSGTYRHMPEQSSLSSTRHDTRNASELKLKTNVDDITQVEVIVKGADELKNLADWISTLPF